MLQENDIQKSVFEKIRTGNVSMRSRVFFVLRMVLVGILALCLFAVSLFVLSFAFFNVHHSGTRFLLGFGNQGLLTFIMLFPWTSLLFALALLIILELVVRHYTPAYRFSLLRIFLWILLIGVVGSALVGATPLHSYLLGEADNHRLPFVGSFYEHVHDQHHEQGIFRGDIISIATSSFIISHNDADLDTDEGSWTIVPPPGFALGTLSIGERVYVAGHLQNGVCYAYGIHTVPNGE